MTKEKLLKMIKYSDLISNRLSSPIPIKHKNRTKQYLSFLQKELNDVKKQIDTMTLEIGGKK